MSKKNRPKTKVAGPAERAALKFLMELYTKPRKIKLLGPEGLTDADLDGKETSNG